MGIMILVTRISHIIGVGAAVLLGFSIPVSTALDTVLVSLIVIAWIVGGRYRDKAAVIHNPVVIASLVIFAAYLAGSLYSIGDSETIFESLRDARIFLILPFLMYFFASRPEAKRLGLNAFMIAVIATLALSWLAWFDLLPKASFLKIDDDNPTPFKLRITHNIFMAFGAYLFAVMTLNTQSRRRRIVFAVLCAAAVFNVLFMVQGRTGYVVLSALMILFSYQAARWKGLAVALVSILLIGGGAWLHKDNALYTRISVTIHELKALESAETVAAEPVIRLNYYVYTLKIIRENPFFGVGTGGFRQAYADVVTGTDHEIALHPHNEYLMVGVQLGLFGLFCYALLFIVQWRYSARMDDPLHRMLARGLVVAILSASPVNSTLIDHSEGLFWLWMSALLYADIRSDFRRRVRSVAFSGHNNEK